MCETITQRVLNLSAAASLDSSITDHRQRQDCLLNIHTHTHTDPDTHTLTHTLTHRFRHTHRNTFNNLTNTHTHTP